MAFRVIKPIDKYSFNLNSKNNSKRNMEVTLKITKKEYKIFSNLAENRNCSIEDVLYEVINDNFNYYKEIYFNEFLMNNDFLEKRIEKKIKLGGLFIAKELFNKYDFNNISKGRNYLYSAFKEKVINNEIENCEYVVDNLFKRIK